MVKKVKIVNLFSLTYKLKMDKLYFFILPPLMREDIKKSLIPFRVEGKIMDF
jgi:hypothetical protein